METKAIIKQLEKALACKEDKELRLRIEVLVDMLKDAPSFPRIDFPSAPSIPQQPLPTYFDNTPVPQPKVTMIKPKNTGKQKKINGAGAIVDNTEQVTYLRPEGT